MDVRFSIPGVVVRRYINDIKGNGLFAEKSFKKDEIIFSESPMFAVQHVYNRPIAWTCGNCYRFLGSLNRQIQHYRTVFGVKEKTELVAFPEGTNQYEFKTGLYSCFAKCGEKYCSEECRKTAFDNHHQILCVGEHTPETSALYQFKKHAIDNNELFFLAAQVISFLVCRVQQLHNDQNGVRDIICAELFKQYTHRAWWDVRIDGNFTMEEAKRWSADSLALLQKAMMPILTSHPKTNDQKFISTILSMDFYSHLLGMLEMNDNSIGFKSPLEQFRKNLSAINSPEQYKQHSNNVMKSVIESFRQYHAEQEDECDDDDCDHDHAMEQDGHDHKSGHGHSSHDEEDMMEDDDHMHDEKAEGEEEDDEEVFPGFDGFGVFGLQAMINHSCVPNCLVVFEQGSSLAYIKALRDIVPGEELFHSYIEESAPFEERSQELVTYGFNCDCPKCTSERPNTTSSSTSSTTTSTTRK
ncbi:hypothetical protein PPL_00338 [Heterostelium album PN500]|uniref:SET domain-containing protein n=1 Tax=Heterostelium pallidum (strain ATCC 26659 / Pp 5 / PN500) TaxID=670386 RepID=D3AW66_HETP5|nr:hypothetical protein PPL_00338 [Heterostelium album PN500]EFA86539.1 hypothetical protein PPL_00338 [Heterostelium album PN500]|eukprot:XP_020438644.1 hypothetical protein PPL_00338 [Heterostelium album PN500]